MTSLPASNDAAGPIRSTPTIVATQGNAVPPDAKPAPQEPTATLLARARATEARFRAIFAGVTDALIISDRNGRVVEVNPAAAALLHDDADALPGRSIRALLNLPSAAVAAIAEAFQRDGAWSGEIALRRSDGISVQVEARVTRIPLDGDELQVAILRDLSPRWQAMQERLALQAREQQAWAEANAVRESHQFLTRTAAMLGSSLDMPETLQRVVSLAVPTLADGCLVDLRMEDGQVRRVAAAHHDPAQSQLIFDIVSQYPLNLNAPHGPARVLRTGEPDLEPEITDEMLVAVARSPEHLQYLREVGIRSQITAPLVSRGQTLGAISFIYYDASGRRYSEADLPVAVEVARYAGMALDNARLYEQMRAAEERTRAIAARVHAVSEASRHFAEANLDLEVVLDVLARQVVELLGDACAVMLLSEDGQWLEPVAVYHPDPETLTMIRQLLAAGRARSTAGMAGRVLQTGKPVLVDRASFAASGQRIPDHMRESLRRFPIRCVLAVPMRARGRIVGVIMAATALYDCYEDEDQGFLQDLADRAALAVEHARLFETERAARADAEAANRAKDEFLSILSHELRTPLTAILGWTRLFRTRTLDPDTMERGLAAVEQSARTQAQLVEDILDVSRIVTGKLRLTVQTIALAPLIESVVATLIPATAAKQIALDVQLDPAAGMVRGDADRVQQIIWNLLANAVKFTPPHGRITVRLAPGDEMAVITVEDNGAGISPEFLPLVFDRFRQADPSSTRKYGGLGLGLSIVRHLVELHGGTVVAHSEGEGRGARFVVSLPRITSDDDTPPHQAPRPEAPQPARLAGVRVLLVEDEEATREMLRVVLEQDGAQVSVAASAAEALDLLLRAQPQVLISDIAMPDDDGYALIGNVRALDPAHGGTIPAIALTAYSGSDAADRARAAGFHHHLAKPIEPQTLVDAILALIAV